MKAGGDELIASMVRKQSASKLLNRELVKRHISVESLDDPISIRPHRPQIVVLVSVGIGVTGEIESVQRPLLAKVF